MGNNIAHVNLTADAEAYIDKTVTELSTKSCEILTTLTRSVMDVCSKSCHLELCNTSRNALNCIEDMKVSNLKPALDQWKSENGFKYHVALYGSGPDAESRANSLDDRIITTLMGIKSSEEFVAPTDTSSPVLNDEHFEELNKAFETCSKNFENLAESTVASINTKASEDITFGSLLEIAEITAGALKSLSGEMANKVKGLGEKVSGKSKTTSQKNTDRGNQAKTTSVSAAQAALVNSMFEDF